jgi:hypothetical protein
MAMAVSDGDDDDRRAPLPDSVDRVFGSAVPESQAGLVLDQEALRRVLEVLQQTAGDSNVDRLSIGELDVLFDGTLAVQVIVEALARRLNTPVRANETLKLVATVR